MKILRISLTNLHSLKGTHVIDLEHSPLADTGLFAITGPTGAGKSTILDAITLALYGKAARYASTPNPTDVMSRHTGECRAEVVFSVPTGRYRAVWELWRARKQPGGNFQPPSRCIYDDQEVPIASLIRDVEEKIEARIGLDYDRFLRSALLAQGEFALFLKAKPAERASLLEQLTGKTLYSTLSKMAYREAERRQTDLSIQEGALGNLSVLTPEQREELAMMVAEGRQALAKGREEGEQLRARMAKAEKLAELLKQEAVLANEDAALAEEEKTAAGSLKRLVRHHQAAVHSSGLQEVTASAKRLEEATAQAVAARGRATQSLLDLATIVEAAVAFGQKTVEAAQTKLQQVREHAEGLARQVTASGGWLKAHEVDGTLADELPELVNQLTQLINARQRWRKANDHRRECEKALQIAEKKVKACQAEEQLEQEATTSLEAAYKAASERFTALKEKSPEEALERETSALDTRIRQQERLLSLLEDQDKLTVAGKTLQEKLNGLTVKLTESGVEVNALTAARDEAEKELGIRQDHFEKSKAIANMESHRALLQPGEACPLCGSLEHPFASHVPGSELKDLQGRVGEAQKILKKAEEALAVAKRQISLLKGEENGLRTSLSQHTNDLAELQTKIADVSRQAELTGHDRPQLEQLMTTSQARAAELKLALQTLREAEKLQASADKSWLEGKARLEAKTSARLRAEQVVEATRRELISHAAAASEEQAAGTGIAGKLAPVVERFGVEMPKADAEDAFIKSMKKRSRTYDERVKAHETLLISQRDAANEIKQLDADLEQLKQRADVLAELQQREQLSGVEPDAGAVVAKRMSWQSLEAAEQETTAARYDLKHAQERAAEAAEAVAKCEADHQARRDALNQALSGGPFPDIPTLQAALMEPGEAESIAEQQQRLRSRRDSLKGRREDGLNAIQQLREAGTVEGDALQELVDLRKALEGRADAIQQKIALDAAALKHDDKVRQQQDALAETVERQRQELRVWSQLRDLIGSADGKKYREFAQAISLDILAIHANRHLTRLSDRYLVRRQEEETLQLQIEDTFQAGATRPMASLSGGESFLVSLALALGLADLAGRNVQIDSLFIDEGFGALDSETLDIAISALEGLQQDNKTIGVISHVGLLKERIAAQVVVKKMANGVSRLIAPTYET